MQKLSCPAAAILMAAVVISPAHGQAPAAPAARPPAAQAPPPAAATPRPAAPRPRPTTSITQIVVRDNSGSGLEGVKVGATGASSLQTTTDAKGMSTATLPPGSYRFRFERPDFLTLERDVTIRAGQPTEIAVALNVAPPPPPPPTPPAPPPPEPKAAAVPSGPPANVSILQFLEKNYIGRDPLKESVLGCTASATTRLLQLRDSLASHTHADSDEVIYVIAGEGMVRIGEQMLQIAPGTLTVIPRGLAHNTERRGRSPLILLSTLAGAPCPSTPNGT